MSHRRCMSDLQDTIEGTPGRQGASLQARLARRILCHIRERRLPVGHHLTEQSLEEVLQVSRSPIRGALCVLAEMGVVERRPNRGFFLLQPAEALEPDGGAVPECADEQVYRAIARDRLAGTLPAVLTETEAMRRYDLPRDRLRAILARIAREGWIERRPGKGWSFLPMIDTPTAYRESLEFRRLLEPAALLMPSFAIDSRVIERLRREQQALLDSNFPASPLELLQADAHFHESLAGLSGNRFVVRSIMRMNQLRALLALHQQTEVRTWPWRRERVLEHLAILDLLERGERQAASRALAQHLAAIEEGLAGLVPGVSSEAGGAGGDAGA
jgi:DNA-binding GntR family transcriptional regulator